MRGSTVFCQPHSGPVPDSGTSPSLSIKKGKAIANILKARVKE